MWSRRSDQHRLQEWCPRCVIDPTAHHEPGLLLAISLEMATAIDALLGTWPPDIKRIACLRRSEKGMPDAEDARETR